MPRPEDIKYVILHITDSGWGSVQSIRQWHTDPPPLGRGWADIGYHYCIGNGYPTYDGYLYRRLEMDADGAIWPGRDLDRDGDVDEEFGAHALGFNSRSLGIAIDPRLTARPTASGRR